MLKILMEKMWLFFNIDIALSAESYEQHDVLDKFASKTLQLSDTADKVKRI